MSSSAPTLYFAYGSNLSLVQMRARCTTAIYVETAVLHDWTWIINSRGYANIIPSASDASQQVYGLVYALTPADEALLDGYESVPWAYTKEMVDVEVLNEDATGVQEVRQVMVYVDRLRVTSDVPKEEYIGRMQRGCREAAEKGVPWKWMERAMGGYFQVR